jgi:signal transduction histidine kinase
VRKPTTAAALLLATVALCVAACGGDARDVHGAAIDAAVSRASSAATWQHALGLWRDRDVRAYAAWRAVDPASPEGREAQRRLDEADTIYRSVISRLRSGEADAEASLAALPGALALAPIDPRLYLPLARALRDHRPPDLVRAAKYYLRFLASGPDDAEAEAAVREVSALDLSASPETATSVRATVRAFDGARASGAPTAAATRPESVPPAALVASGIAGGLALAALGALLAAWRRPRGSSLARASEASPELHPAITYLVGCLRHELLKHRIGAASDALAALVRGEATPQQRGFLHGRLFGGEPLLAAWEGHLRAFERALGPRVDLRGRDRSFRDAGRAIAAIQRLEGPLARDPAAAVPDLARAHAKLRAFDRELAHLAARLVRTRVDETLLREVIGEVQSEYSAGLVALDEVRVHAPDEPIDVEVFRVDLVLVLKNLVRNAILAVGRDPAPRRLAVDVSVTVEPTGEEMVRIHVRDTSPETITEDSIRERRADRGLGLVSAALARYDAAISVEPGDGDFKKAVTLRFFRALGEADNDVEHAGASAAHREAA